MKPGLRALGLGNGVLRPPYLLPGESDQAALRAGFEHLGLMTGEGLDP